MITIYGQQQGARVGYNPKKKGRRSYHPLFCFEAQQCRFQKLQNGWEVGEFFANINQKWNSPHRFIVVRRPIPEDPQEAKQLKLFKDTKYIYPIFVTNLTLSPWRVYLFSANIVHWFKRLCLPKEYLTATLDTIRADFLVLPAKLTKHGIQNILTFPKDYHYRQEFQQASDKIQKLHLPKNFRFCK